MRISTPRFYNNREGAERALARMQYAPATAEPRLVNGWLWVLADGPRILRRDGLWLAEDKYAQRGSGFEVAT